MKSEELINEENQQMGQKVFYPPEDTPPWLCVAPYAILGVSNLAVLTISA